MNKSLNILGITIALLLCAGPIKADTIKSDYNHEASFAQMHTYSWGDVKTSNPLYVDRIKQAVNQQLQAKGWQLVPNGGDTTIFANGDVRDEKQLETLYNGFGPGWGGGWGWRGWGWGSGAGFGTSTTTTRNQPVAKLVIDIFTTSDKKLAWRGVIQRNVSDNSEKNIKNLNKDVAKVFKKFPPKGES